MPTILLALAVSWLLTRKLPRMAVITAVVVTIFGGLTLILRDDTFVKMKPTILYGVFAGILGFGLLRGQSYLKYLMDELIPMRDEGWMKFTTRFVAFYLLLAVLNEVVWRSYGTDVWVNFRTFVLPAGEHHLHHDPGAALPALRGRRPGGQGVNRAGAPQIHSDCPISAGCHKVARGLEPQAAGSSPARATGPVGQLRTGEVQLVEA